MNREKDYYQILGVNPGATSTEIRRAYRRLAVLNHPDRNSTAQATLRMQEINEAYNVLGNTHKRIQYDSGRVPSSPVRTQTTTAPRAAPATPRLQQIFAENVTRRTTFFPLALAIIVFVVSTCVFVGSVESWGWQVTVLPFFIALLSLVCIGFLFFLRLSQAREIETQCPRCKKFQAAEQMNEKRVFIFKKEGFLALFGINDAQSFFDYGRYKIHYRCKYCSYEWEFIKTKRESIS